MRNHNYLLVLALACAVPATAFAAQQATGKATAASRLTVGDFAGMLAASRQSGPDLDASRAVDGLIRSGVPLGDLGAALTEQKLAEIMSFYGVRATTSSSSAAVSQGKAEAALLLIGSGRLSADPKSSTRTPTPQTIDDCLGLANHGQCVNCCKALGTASASSCSRTCFQINKGSSPEPIP